MLNPMIILLYLGVGGMNSTQHIVANCVRMFKAGSSCDWEKMARVYGCSLSVVGGILTREAKPSILDSKSCLNLPLHPIVSPVSI